MANTIITTVAKVTKVDNFNAIKDYIPEDRTDLIEFIDKQIEQTRKKNAYKSSSPKVDKNAELRELVYDAVASASEPIKVAQIAELDGFADVPKGRITAMLTQLCKADRVISQKYKGVNVYAIATSDGDTE